MENNYYEIEVTDEQLTHAKRLGERIAQKRKGNKEMCDELSKHRTDEEVNFVGYLGEIIFADKYNLERPQVLEQVDDGWDFKYLGIKYQVKTSKYINGNLILFKERVEKDFDVIVLIELDLKNKIARIYNAITKEDFKTRMEIKDFGYGERYALRSEKI